MPVLSWVAVGSSTWATPGEVSGAGSFAPCTVLRISKSLVPEVAVRKVALETQLVSLASGFPRRPPGSSVTWEPVAQVEDRSASS